MTAPASGRRRAWQVALDMGVLFAAVVFFVGLVVNTTAKNYTGAGICAALLGVVAVSVALVLRSRGRR